MESGFERERAWLMGLGQKIGEKKPTLFALVGFGKEEAEYLLSLARECLKKVEVELSWPMETMERGSLQKLDHFQYSFFEKRRVPLYDIGSSSLSEQKKWMEKLAEIGSGAFLVSKTMLDSSWKLFFPSFHFLDVVKEKIWEKRARLVEWLIAFLKSQGVAVSPFLAGEIVEAHSFHRRSLRTQAQVWLDEKGYQGDLQPEDLALDPIYSVWKLLEDLWAWRAANAFEKAKHLLREEPSGISLSSFLRQQWSELGNSFEEGAQAPSPSPSFVVKKERELRARAARLGFEGWREGLCQLHHMQVELRSSRPALALFERILVVLVELQKGRFPIAKTIPTKATLTKAI